MFTNMFFTFDGLLHVLAENGHTTLCGHEKPKKCKPHNYQAAAPICTACLAKASPHIRQSNLMYAAKKHEPIVKPYKPASIPNRRHVEPLEGQMELFSQEVESGKGSK